MALTIKARQFCPRGQVILLPNVDHPEVDLFMTLEQERPRWWRVQQEWDRLCEAIRSRP